MDLSEEARCKYRLVPIWGLSLILICGVFFLGLFLTKKNQIFKTLVSPVAASGPKAEVFGFAPFWSLNKMDNIDWDTLTSFAYFSLPAASDGTIDRTSYEWEVFNSNKLKSLFDKAKEHKVRRLITLTQMEAAPIEELANNPEAWKELALESIEILKNNNLDGVNIDFEYMSANDSLKANFSDFMDYYSKTLKNSLPDSYITVSVVASSARFNKIYDVGRLAKSTDAIFMMAYDFYYPGSDTIGPSAPLYGYNNGKGPFWYDVSTAVDDFLKVVPPEKIILGVPYYGWNYPAADPKPQGERSPYRVAISTTQEKASKDKLIATTPIGGWDPQAHVSWRGYWDENGWHVVYMEDTKSLSDKYDFAKTKKLGGVGIWALGFDNGDQSLWTLLRDKFAKGSVVRAT